MPSFKTQVPHALGQEVAAEKLKGFLEKVRQRYQDQVSNLEESWSENTLNYSFKSYGFTIKGVVDVQPDQVNLQGDLPIAAMMFKGKIEESIRTEVEKALA